MTAPAKYRARFRQDPSGGWWFSIIDRTGRIVRESWCAGPKSSAMGAADGEIATMNGEQAPKLPPAHDLGGEAG